MVRRRVRSRSSRPPNGRDCAGHGAHDTVGRDSPIVSKWPMLDGTPARFALVALVLGGCGTAPQPSAQSAASPRAAEAPRSDVVRALTSEPPLPSEDTAGWPGLAPRAGRGSAPAHQHHAGMNMAGAAAPTTPDGGAALVDAAASTVAVDGSSAAPPASALPSAPGGHVHGH